MVRYNLVFRRVDQEGRCGVGAATKVRKGGDGGYEVGRGRRGPVFAIGGTDTIEEEREAMPVFEEGEDKLGAWVARAHPA